MYGDWGGRFGLNVWWNLKGWRAPLGNPNRLSDSLVSGRDYAELVHPRSQGTRMEAQDRCGPAFPLDAPFGFRKDYHKFS